MFGEYLTSEESLSSMHTIPEVYEALASLDIEKSCGIDRIAHTPLVFYVIVSCYFTLMVENSIK